jgi:recombination DNA repair RAD52 pathway protein
MPQSPRNKQLIDTAESVETEIAERVNSMHDEQTHEEFWVEKDKRDQIVAKRDRSEQERLLSELSEPFSSEVERELRKGAAVLIYIPVSEVIARLNRVFGVLGWSSEIIKCERDALDPDCIVAHVRLTVSTSEYGQIVQKDGFGGQKIKRTKTGDIIDLGNEFKGAVSDALKKAAQQFGVALYLSRSDESLNQEIEREHAANAPKIDPNILALWAKFREASKDFSAEQKTKLNEFWTKYSNGRPKPSPETATMQDIMALIEESTRISFPGSEFEG